jgi:DNA-binding Lrp family transcriptional regulator
MSVISEDIRRVIQEYLKKNGKTRSTTLIEEVSKEVNASPKPCYRELKFLVRSGFVLEYSHNRANIEYELPENKKIEKSWYENFDVCIEKFYLNYKKQQGIFSELRQQERVHVIVNLLYGLDMINNEISLFQYVSKNFKKSQRIEELHSKIQRIKKEIFNLMVLAKSTDHQEIFNMIRMDLRSKQERYLNFEFFQKHGFA